MVKTSSTPDRDGHKTDTVGATLSIGAGLPPVPRKLVNRIQAGEFVDMAELLPDRMGITTAPLFTEDKDDKQAMKSKGRQVTNILEWVQCYSIYVAVLTVKCPNKIQDLMGYIAGSDRRGVRGVWERNMAGIRSTIPTDGGCKPRHCLGQDRPDSMEHGLHSTRKTSHLFVSV